MKGMNAFMTPENKKIIKAMDNDNRLKIIFLCWDKEYAIKKIAEKLKLPYNNTFANVKQLASVGLVNIIHKKNEKHQPSLVKTSKVAKTYIDFFAKMSESLMKINK